MLLHQSREKVAGPHILVRLCADFQGGCGALWRSTPFHHGG